MDSSELNKIIGGLLGAFLVFLLLNFVSGQIYGTGGGGHHGEEPLAFALETADSGDHVEEETVEATDYSALVANADLANGEKAYRKCKTCHALEDGKHGAGPSLWGVVGRDIASIDGFAFTQALTGLEGDWDLQALGEFLKSPKKYASGTKMAFAGIKDAQDRVDLIAFLNQADGTPVELAAAPAAPATAADDAKAEEKAEETKAEETTEETKVEDAKAEVNAEEAKAEEKTEETKVEDAKAEVKAEEAKAAEKTEETKTEETTAEVKSDEAAAEDAKVEETKTEEAKTEAAKEEEAKVDETKAEDETTEVAAADATGSAETAPAFAGGDAEAGKKIYRKCKACHKLEEGKKGVGPSLWGVINRDIASVEGFKYSKALQELPGNWTATELSKFLTAPMKYAKGSKMAFGGLKKPKDIVDLLTYLNEADGTPDPLK